MGNTQVHSVTNLEVTNCLENNPNRVQEMVDSVCLRNYLRELSISPVLPYTDRKDSGITWLKIYKIVYEKDIFFADNMSMLYTALHQNSQTLALVVRKNNKQEFEFYLGARDIPESKNFISGSILDDGLKGYLPGIEIERVPTISWEFKSPSVASVSGIASLRDDKKQLFIQGIERLINTTINIPHFTAIFLADSVSNDEQISIRRAYETIFTQLSSISESTISYTEGESKSVSTNITEGVTKTIGESISRTVTKGTGRSKSTTETEGKSRTHNWSACIYGYNRGINRSKADQNGTSCNRSKSKQKGENTSAATNASESKGESLQSTNNTTNQIKTENKSVKEIMSKIEKQLNRMQSAESFGMWNVATYFISESYSTSVKLANIYRGIISGENSGIETSFVNSWLDSNSECQEIMDYLRHYRHPIFMYEKLNVTAGSMVSSEELVVHLSLPQSSIPGVLVKETAVFGRNIVSENISSPKIELGCIQHLGAEDKEQKVSLNLDELASHTLITGSTGSGKSNVSYLLLSRLKQEGVKFLVIESAKGEYKNVFGGEYDVSIYGTNPSLTPLLQLDPFCFPAEIHVHEHIDRLVEIFNACWPMYAAMPAVLKVSIENAYIACGWDMVNSVCEFNIFPSFNDVVEELNRYINDSEYSDESKGDYKGALVTRLKSLTHGIVGQIFVRDATSDESLFNENVIVDLSRVGSSETKSLIMGILVLKLNEFRISENKGMNQALKHITVLEEAHNLLKRTSTDQSQESSNLIGKSVEMIANSIAEMRTYGEGFVIVDQSPAMLDMTAIRNTNTKIIMALPDFEDRLSAGRSVGLTEQQTEEISKLKRGVGIIYQNSWAEPVLCKIDKYNNTESMYSHIPEIVGSSARLELFRILRDTHNNNLFVPTKKIKELLIKSNIDGRTLNSILSMLEDEDMGDMEGEDTIGEEAAAEIFAQILGVAPLLKCKDISPKTDFNKMMLISLKYLLSKDEYNLFTSYSLLSLYLHGCEYYSNSMFYEKWINYDNSNSICSSQN